MNPGKRGLNIFSLFMILFFLALLVIETMALIAGVPEVSDNIVYPHFSTESDMILENCDNSSLMINPNITGTKYTLENHIIFTPDNPLEDGKIYHLKCGQEGVDFRAVKAEKLDYAIVGGFREHIVIAFNMGVNHSEVESLISFQPNTTYSSVWYHNTLVIRPDASPFIRYKFRIDGNITGERDERKLSISATFIGGYGTERTILEPTSIPSYPVTYTFIILPPGIPALTGLLSGYNFLLYYIFIVSSILASFGYLCLRYGKETWNELRKFHRDMELKVPSKNPVFDIGTVFFATIGFTVIFYYVVEIFNPNPTVPDFSRMKMWEQMYSLARAGVWEEIVTRIPFIGIPLLFVHLFAGKRNMPLYRYVLGGGFRMDRLTLILISICAFMFGFVHMLGGWDAYKIIPAMVAGMAMGYLYARYGIWASVLVHFSIDYLTIPAYVFDLSAIDMGINLLIFVGIFIGIYFFYLYSKAFFTEFFGMGKKVKTSKIEVKLDYPEKYSEEWEGYGDYGIPYAQHPYRCYRCGNTEAEYIGDGLLKCTRCGALSRLPPFPPPRV